jgi:hypothetical protein
VNVVPWLVSDFNTVDLNESLSTIAIINVQGIASDSTATIV